MALAHLWVAITKYVFVQKSTSLPFTMLLSWNLYYFYSISFGQTQFGSWWSYWFVGSPSFLLKGTITNGMQTPMLASVTEKAMIGWRWMKDLNHPLPYIPWVTPTAPAMVVSMPISWPSMCTIISCLFPFTGSCFRVVWPRERWKNESHVVCTAALSRLYQCRYILSTGPSTKIDSQHTIKMFLPRCHRWLHALT